MIRFEVGCSDTLRDKVRTPMVLVCSMLIIPEEIPTNDHPPENATAEPTQNDSLDQFLQQVATPESSVDLPNASFPPKSALDDSVPQIDGLLDPNSAQNVLGAN